MFVAAQLQRGDEFGRGIGKNASSEIERGIEQFFPAQRKHFQENIARRSVGDFPGMALDQLAEPDQVVVVPQELGENLDLSRRLIQKIRGGTASQAQVIKKVFGSPAPIVKQPGLRFLGGVQPGLTGLSIASPESGTQIPPPIGPQVPTSGPLAGLAEAAQNDVAHRLLLQRPAGAMFLRGEDPPQRQHNQRAAFLEKPTRELFQRGGLGLRVPETVERVPGIPVKRVLVAHTPGPQGVPQKLHQGAQFLEMLARFVDRLAQLVQVQAAQLRLRGRNLLIRNALQFRAKPTVGLDAVAH